MNSRIIESVAGYYFSFVVAVAISKAARIIICPWHVASEFFHLAYVAEVVYVRHSVVYVVQKAGQGCVGRSGSNKIGRCTYSVKTIYNEHGLFNI